MGLSILFAVGAVFFFVGSLVGLVAAALLSAAKAADEWATERTSERFEQR